VLNTPITHPVILGALAAAGHKSTILISDAFFAASTTTGPNATRVFLNLEPGIPTVTRVVELVARMTPVEQFTMMREPEGGTGEVAAEIGGLLGAQTPHELLERADFYDRARSSDLALCIVTGDTRRFANVVLRVGAGTVPARP
jgi:L-fucose mutarotase